MIFIKTQPNDLQARLDDVREQANRSAADALEAAPTPPDRVFFMGGLFGQIPGTDTSPLRTEPSAGFRDA